VIGSDNDDHAGEAATARDLPRYIKGIETWASKAAELIPLPLRGIGMTHRGFTHQGDAIEVRKLNVSYYKTRSKTQ
jgi:hypothetical protein